MSYFQSCCVSSVRFLFRWQVTQNMMASSKLNDPFQTCLKTLMLVMCLPTCSPLKKYNYYHPSFKLSNSYDTIVM